MGVRRRGGSLLLFCLQSSLWLRSALVAGSSWNILNMFARSGEDVGMSLENYCESWKVNVELHNIRKFSGVPGECAGYVSNYVTSPQYKADLQRAADEAALFLTESFFSLGGDGKDAWIFDVDDTLLSNVEYYKKHNFGALVGCSTVAANRSLLESWMFEEKAPAVEHIKDLYYHIKGLGLKMFIISSRKEYCRDATVGNLLKAGYLGWTELILRDNYDGFDGVKEYKEGQRKRLTDQGYRVWGIVGDQWSSLLGHPNAKRTFKISNPMYYVD